MKASDIPIKMAVPFAASAGGGFTHTVPVPSQIGVTPGAASFTTGFPPDTFIDPSAGGTPPLGQEFNGLFNAITQWTRWFNAGGALLYNSAFSSTVSGYPKGAVVASSSFGLYWLNTIDDNANNPDTGGAGWGSFILSTNIFPLAGASVTYAMAQVPLMIARSNSGAAMIDTLPGTGPGVLPAGAIVTINNADATALLFVKAGAGATLAGPGGTASIYLGPGQTARILSNGSDYKMITGPDRAKMTADTTIFIATGGSNNGSGLTVGDPLQTAQFAVEMGKNRLDLQLKKLKFKFADGTYAGWLMAGAFTGQFDDGRVIFEGNTTTRANVILTPDPMNGTCMSFLTAQGEAHGFTLNPSGGNHSIQLQDWSRLIATNLTFMASSGSHVRSTNSTVGLDDYTITGGAQAHINSDGGGSSGSNGTVVLTGTPNFSGAFVIAADNVEVDCTTATFSGAATGTRYLCTYNATIKTQTGFDNFFPGNAAGARAAGGIVDVIPRFKALKNGSAQGSLAAGTPVAVTWPATAYNIGAFFGSNIWFPPSGPVAMFAQCESTTFLVDQLATIVSITKNGVVLAENLIYSSGTGSMTVGVYVEDTCVGGDLYGVNFEGDGTGLKTISGTNTRTYFCGHCFG